MSRKTSSVFLSFFLACFLVLLPVSGAPQGATPTGERLASWKRHEEMKKSSPFGILAWRPAGPCFTGGRISSIAADPRDPYTFYVAAGSGGIWKTTNNGVTWKPVFDRQCTFTIGDLEVSPSDPDILWAGSGEELMARSSFAGMGVFKSTDGGKTWKRMGLEATQHIGRIVIDPKDPDTVYVAAIGHNYTYNSERGVYKTTDGGRTWKKILYVSEKAGAVDLVMDPADRRTLYAAMWERDRKAWNNVESGPGSGIYKTTDGGRTWRKLTNGFPMGKYVGRIGLAVAPSDPDILYALLDNQAPMPKREVKKLAGKGRLTILQVEKMSKAEFLALDPGKLTAFLRRMGVPSRYKGAGVQDLVRKGKLTPASFARYLLDLNADRKLHVTDIEGGQVYRSDDGGKTWRKVNEKHLDFFFNTYGYSFCDVRVAPDNPDKVYICGIRLLTSEDGGKKWRDLTKAPAVHLDNHDLWIDPAHPSHLLLGTDGGLYASYDRGETWRHYDNLPVAEFYAISLDDASPFRIWGGTQDNGTVYGPSTYRPAYGRKDPWKKLRGGDGFFVFVDPADPNTVYSLVQFGGLARHDLAKGTWKDIMPKAGIGEAPLRCNWMTPFLVSRFNHLVLYFGANRVLRSLDRGDHWWPISPDLTTKKPYGDVPYATITSLSESPLRPGLLYAGTDDGRLWVTKNEGGKWEEIGKKLPGKWVSRVTASRYAEGRVYVCETGYREDDFGIYVFRSDDYGKTWKSISAGLPAESANVIREDPLADGLLYLGTDLGIYGSTSGGGNWFSLCSNLPTSAVHDIRVHPRDRKLVIGTHGRSAWVMNVWPLQEAARRLSVGKEAFLLPRGPSRGRKGRAAVWFFLPGGEGKATVSLLGKDGKILASRKVKVRPGLNRVDVEIPGRKKEAGRPALVRVRWGDDFLEKRWDVQ